MTRLSDYVEEIFIITCSRCKFDGQSYADFITDAEQEFLTYGWTVEQVEGTFFTGDPLTPHIGMVNRVYCPRCNGNG